MQNTNQKRALQITSIISNPKIILKLVGVSLIWKITGIILGFIINWRIFFLFVVILFGVLWFFPYWQPAYSVIHFIAGDKNISPKLDTYHLEWFQLSGVIIKVLVLAYITYLAIQMMLK